MKQDIILVNESDESIGTAGKMEVHEKGLLHRAFSVFIFNHRGEMLLQQRAMNKYHSAGLWTNTCCSHPMPGEETEAAAIRRLQEEMGFETPLKKVFDFIYKASLENGLTEHEFDHVFIGEYEGPVYFSNEEVMEIAYLPVREISTSLEREPENYTTWFRIAFPRVKAWWEQNYKNRVA